MMLFCTPTESELFHVRKALELQSEYEWGGQRISEGRLHGCEVVVATCGVGKAMSAAVCSLLLERYRPEMLLLGGIGGGLDPHLLPGEAVIGREYLQWDLNAGSAGIPAGCIPRSRKGGAQPRGPIRADAELLERLLRAGRGAGEEAASVGKRRAAAERETVPVGSSFRQGIIVSGDTLAVSPADKLRLREEWSGAVADMEGAAAGLAAELAEVPFAGLRYVFDAADGGRASDIRRFTDEVAADLLRIWSAVAEELE